jgi:UDP-N-acetylmuramoyl-L-alanyl-D-glutamate--2,6-diaminopimelate ligase
VRLDELLSGTGVEPGPSSGTEISAICNDSRRAVPGSLFVAIEGYDTDGHRYIPRAFESGAVAAVTERETDCPGTCIVNPSGDNRHLLGVICARFFGYPWREFCTIGITGTNGKTTTAHMIRWILEHRGVRTGLMGTVGHVAGGESRPAVVTTPDSLAVTSLMREMLEGGDRACVMEVSSHALSMARVDEVRFDCALFTNISQDHLDFHAGMEDYLRAKLHLLDLLKQGGAVVVCGGYREFAGIPGSVSYGDGPSDDYRISGVAVDLSGSDFTISTPGGEAGVRLNVPGRVNVWNCSGAIAACMETGSTLRDCISAIGEYRGVPGRLEVVDNPFGFLVAVDYAHTPDALERLLEQVREISGGRVIVVFGAGGDRDRGKRPVMGRIAVSGSDVAVVTSDNPRTEDPRSIIDDILRGSGTGPGVIVEPDRRRAIGIAVKMASEGDAVIIAGKGHEDYQVLGREKVHFDDREEARRALDERGDA